ncbi:MAG: Smr/MutS family protein [Candidatus Latescibacterota bacterium]|nr:Smr/MutS family protein [Candidatus Latescibacterota bacterium]
MENDLQPMDDDPVEVPIDGTLDLHMFNPRDLKILLPEYFSECQKRGILEVRVIHGKGTGTLKKSVLSLLKRLDMVDSYRSGGLGEGSWGATMVMLKCQRV